MNWKLIDEDGWSLTLTDTKGHTVGILKARTDEQKADARKVAVAPEMVALLEQIVDEEQARYDREYRAACEHNNSDWVGIKFDYAPYPTHPDWFNTARDILARAKEGEL